MWQSIETAPKDTTEIIDIWACSGGDMRFGERFTDCEFFRGKWHYQSNGDWYEVDFKPTHWMSIPEPPTNGE
jgi:hypothetical protein